MSVWGPLKDRYENMARVRRILALDGGGIRGVLTLEVLAKIEAELSRVRKAGPEFRLCDAFDYIGGTSTGAILAAGLARGMSVAELQHFYASAGPLMFEKRRFLGRLKSFYKDEPLAKMLQTVFGKNTDLSPEHLRCILLVVTRNATTDSPWPVSSNPLARYNDRARADCNLKIPLWRLVRASTAAPIYFPPEVLPWDPSDPDKTFVFVDGGMTPYNNPAFLMYRMATLPAYKLQWPAGERKLVVISLGTGSAPFLDGDVADPERNIPTNLMGLPSALMNSAKVDQDINCRVLGRCVHGQLIDREIGDLIPTKGEVPNKNLGEDLGRAFVYGRYDAELTAEGLAKRGLAHIQPEKVQALDALDALAELQEVGRSVAQEFKASDYGDLFHG